MTKFYFTTPLTLVLLIFSFQFLQAQDKIESISISPELATELNVQQILAGRKVWGGLQKLESEYAQHLRSNNTRRAFSSR